MSDHILILEFLGLNTADWQDHRIEEHFAKEYEELAELLESHAAEQRELCAVAVGEICDLLDMFDTDVEMAKEACLNAVKKSDD